MRRSVGTVLLTGVLLSACATVLRKVLRCTQPQLQANFEIADLPGRYTKALRKAASAVAAEYFAAITAYRLDPDDFQQSLAKPVLQAVAVRDGEVVVTIGL